MYRVEHFGPVAEPGQRVEFEYLEGSDFLGRAPCSSASKASRS